MWTLFLFKSEKKTVEGHLKQMREGLRNKYFLTRQYKHMFWALKSTVSLRQLF